MTSLADAVREQFERDHPRGKNTLLCAQCRRRLDREDFRETPWHGRAARCTRCEGGGWHRIQDERIRWELAQAREKLHAYQRFAAHLKYVNFRRRYVMGLSSVHVADLPEFERPKRRRLMKMGTIR
ncbi:MULTISPECIES: hypothetical protein [unclassified Streptomyces]|uniref:hypothetical protein n=1 Tax=unclassified Streptomyces TaxID=2593676 RepID=UPI0036E7D51D